MAFARPTTCTRLQRSPRLARRSRCLALLAKCLGKRLAFPASVEHGQEVVAQLRFMPARVAPRRSLHRLAHCAAVAEYRVVEGIQLGACGVFAEARGRLS